MAFCLTERCDNYCLMCSQPPRKRDDHWLLEEGRDRSSRQLPEDAAELTFTGGEPTIYGEEFLDLLELCRFRTAGHGESTSLSNGRRFADADFAAEVLAKGHPQTA